ncbi:DM DNA binding domain protein, partial [Teladorsagia circumcincta]
MLCPFAVPCSLADPPLLALQQFVSKILLSLAIHWCCSNKQALFCVQAHAPQHHRRPRRRAVPPSMALCDITTTPQLFTTVDSSHFRQFFPQIRIESHGLLQKSGITRKAPQLGQLDFMAENDNKKIYFCQRCLNHGSRLPRKNHKCECPYADCKCKLCFLVEKRRQLNSQLHDLEVIELESTKRTDDDDQQPPSSNSDGDRMVRVKGERVPNCQKCGQHGQKSRLKGHKRLCPFKDCLCAK